MTDGTGAAANFNQPTHAVSDGTYLYIADSRNGLIRKLDIATGSVTTMAGKAGNLGTTDGIGTAARFGAPFGIAIHSGSLYVSDVNAIRKIVISTGEVSTLSTTVRSSLGSVSITAAGDSLFIADTSDNRILRVVVATGVVTTFAGSSSSGLIDRIGAAARFSFPSAITATSDGAWLFVSDNFFRIRRIEVATAAVTTMTTSANVGARGMATDHTYLYVTRGAQVLQVNIATGVVASLAGRDGTSGSIDGDFSVARFYYPFGITPVAGSLYITEAFNHTVRKLDLTARTVSTVAGTPTGTDGVGAAARFSDILGMTTDGTHLYLAEWVNHTVRKIVIATGAVTTLAGLAGTMGNANGAGSIARLVSPTGITTDGDCAAVLGIHFWDIQVPKRLRSAAGMPAAARAVLRPSRLATSRRAMTATNDSTPCRLPCVLSTPALPRRLRQNPRLLRLLGGRRTSCAPSMNLYVTAGNAIRKIALATGEVTTLAGSTYSYGTMNATGITARFNLPTGITTDGTHLYVADFHNHTIRKVVIGTGEVTTLAGLVGTSGSVDGMGGNARFTNPLAVTTDGTYVYVSNGTAAIRRIALSDGAVSTLTLSGDTRNTVAVGITTDGTSLYISTGVDQRIRKIALATGAITTIVGQSLDAGEVDGDATAARFWMPYGITADGTRLFVTDQWGLTVRAIQ